MYILLGNDPEAIENTWRYIGKTENFVERLRDRDKRSRSGKESRRTSEQRRRGGCQASCHKRADSLRQDDAKHESECDGELFRRCESVAASCALGP